MINKGLFTSNSDEWETPQELFDELNKEFHFNLDPCATEKNAKCSKYFTKKDDGLHKKWDGRVFMNPPYGRKISQWVEKAYKEWWNHRVTIVCLLPARTDTKWFHDYCIKTDEIRFIKGRLKFSKMKNSAPFPSMIVIFRGN